MTIDPVLTHNALWAVGTLIYVKACIATCDFLVRQRLLASHVSRKIVHVAACNWCLFWPQFNTAHWSWKFNVTVPALYMLQLLVKGAIVRDRQDPDVVAMTRHGDPTELLYGPFFFTLVMIFCGLCEYLQPMGTYIMGSLVGDGIAPLVGKHYPWLPYPTWGGDQKTVSGSLGMFVGSALGICIYAHVLGVPKDVDVESVLMISLVATLAEAVTGIWDNPAIALSVYWFVTATDIQIQI